MRRYLLVPLCGLAPSAREHGNQRSQCQRVALPVKIRCFYRKALIRIQRFWSRATNNNRSGPRAHELVVSIKLSDPVGAA